MGSRPRASLPWPAHKTKAPHNPLVNPLHNPLQPPAQSPAQPPAGNDVPFVNNYGVWVDEFKALGLEHTLERSWPDATCYFRESKPVQVRASARPPTMCVPTPPHLLRPHPHPYWPGTCCTMWAVRWC